MKAVIIACLEVKPHGVLPGQKFSRLTSARANSFATVPTSGRRFLPGAKYFFASCGWSGSVMVLGKLPVPGRPTVWMMVGQGPPALAEVAGGGCLDFLLSSIFSLLCLPVFGRRPDIDRNIVSKGRLTQRNQPTIFASSHI